MIGLFGLFCRVLSSPDVSELDVPARFLAENVLKHERSRSLSFLFQEGKSPPKPASGTPVAVGASDKKDKDKDLPMESPIISEKCTLALSRNEHPIFFSADKIPKNMRSDLEAPLIEEGFVKHHGDTQNLIGFQRVDIDFIGRTGMYMERRGMAPEKKVSGRRRTLIIIILITASVRLDRL